MELGIDPLIILRLNLQKQLGIAVGVVAVILGLYVYLYFLDVQTQIENLDADVARQAEEIQKKEAMLRKKPQLEKELEELAIREAEASKVLPMEKQIPDLLATVSAKATIQGLKNNLFQPKPEVPSGIYATIPIDLEIQGTYHQMGMFMDEMAKLFRIVKVTDFKVRPMEGRPGTKQDVAALSIGAKAFTYRFVNKAPELPTKKGKKAGKAGDQGGAK